MFRLYLVYDMKVVRVGKRLQTMHRSSIMLG